MKNILQGSLVILLLFISNSISAQFAIGTKTPDPSSVLDIFSTTRGVLLPRLTAEEKGLIVLPAKGLMIYNSSTNDVELNTGTAELPSWTGTKTSTYASHAIESISEGSVISVTSTDDILVPGMTLSPLPGTYMLLFNAQMVKTGIVFTSDQGVTDVNALYSELINQAATDTHGLVFGTPTGEVLPPGIYNVTGAASIAGTLKLDGNGDPNAFFIIRSSGAFTTGVGAIVELINGTTANNVFWVSEGAMSTGAGTIMKGTLVSHANAVSLGADTNLEGRMFTTGGAVSMGASCFLAAPAGASAVSLGVLSTFIMFTASGSISGCSGCGINGDVGTAVGAATLFENINGTVYGAGTTSTPIAAIITYTIYLEGSMVPNSSRTFTSPNSNVSLQSMVTVAAGESVEIRWKVDNDEALISNRVLSLIRSN